MRQKAFWSSFQHILPEKGAIQIQACRADTQKDD